MVSRYVYLEIVSLSSDHGELRQQQAIYPPTHPNKRGIHTCDRLVTLGKYAGWKYAVNSSELIFIKAYLIILKNFLLDNFRKLLSFYDHLVSAGRAQFDLIVVDGLGESECDSPPDRVLLTAGRGARQTFLGVLKLNISRKLNGKESHIWYVMFELTFYISSDSRWDLRSFFYFSFLQITWEAFKKYFSIIFFYA